MNQEIECIEKNKTWKLVDRVENKKKSSRCQMGLYEKVR